MGEWQGKNTCETHLNETIQCALHNTLSIETLGYRALRECKRNTKGHVNTIRTKLK